MTGHRHGPVKGTRPGGGRAGRGKSGPRAGSGSRTELVSASVPFASGVTASLAGRPHDCECPWAPEFTGQPGSFQVTGRFRLKFVNVWCPSHRKYAVRHGGTAG